MAPIDYFRDQAMETPFADERDAGLFLALVQGVVRWQGYLDWVLGHYSSHPIPKMKPLVRQALRLGLYQLLFLDRIPPSAAVNETVKLLQQARQPQWIKGFVNGLLRKIGRVRESLPQAGQPDDTGTIPGHCLFSHPQWLYERWLKRYGQEITGEICRSNNQEPDLTLRVHGISVTDFLGQLQGAGISARPGSFAPDSVKLAGARGAVEAVPGFWEGHFQVQDEAAQLATLLMGPLQSGARYLDGCAGLGGKTSALASLLPEGGHLVAVEPDALRFQRLGQNLERLGLLERVERSCCKLETLSPEISKGYNGVLIDAPCSGLGVVRRHPDIRWNRTEESLQEYQAKQLALLTAGAGLLACGGILVYVTCSMEPEENEDVVALFLRGRSDFRVDDCRKYLSENSAQLVDETGFFRSRPDQGLDGFFGARLLFQGI